MTVALSVMSRDRADQSNIDVKLIRLRLNCVSPIPAPRAHAECRRPNQQRRHIDRPRAETLLLGNDLIEQGRLSLQRAALLALPLELLDALVRRWQVFGRRPADLLDGFPYGLTDLVVRPIGRLFALH